MSQPVYGQEQLAAMTNEQIAAKLREWARARQYVSQRRQTQGKEPLEVQLLCEAAGRLEVQDGMTVGVNWCGGIETEDVAKARVVAKGCVLQARKKWGAGWNRLTPEQQQNAVASEVVQLVLTGGYTPETLRAIAQWAYNVMEE